MAEKQITLIAKVKAKDGCQEQLKQLTMAMLEPTRAENGCIKYDLHIHSEDKGSFMFYETWASKEALDEHIATPHLQNFLEKGKDILAEPLDVAIWEKIG